MENKGIEVCAISQIRFCVKQNLFFKENVISSRFIMTAIFSGPGQLKSSLCEMTGVLKVLYFITHKKSIYLFPVNFIVGCFGKKKVDPKTKRFLRA